MQKELASVELSQKNIIMKGCCFAADFKSLSLGIKATKNGELHFFVEIYYGGSSTVYMMNDEIIDDTVRKVPDVPIKYNKTCNGVIVSKNDAQRLLDDLVDESKVSFETNLCDVRVELHFEGLYFDATEDKYYCTEQCLQGEFIDALELTDDESEEEHRKQTESERLERCQSDRFQEVLGNDFAEERLVGHC